MFDLRKKFSPNLLIHTELRWLLGIEEPDNVSIFSFSIFSGSLGYSDAHPMRIATKSNLGNGDNRSYSRSNLVEDRRSTLEGKVSAPAIHWTASVKSD